MERLTAQQRAGVGKMSDDRLKLRLVQAGYQAEDVGRLGSATDICGVFGR